MPRAVITGAFSYIGSAAARELRRRGWRIHTLTNRARPAGAEHVTAAPLRFDHEDLVRELKDADAFVNTFWIRMPCGGQSFESAVERSRLLVNAAAQACVRRLVHVSVSNASLDSPLGYYRGKAEVDEAVRSCRLSHAILRPTLVVGEHDVLTSNIAWLLRRFPIFPVPAGGRYRLQPVTLHDTARVIADAVESDASLDIDAAGPEIMSFRDYVALVARACGLRRAVISAPRWVALLAIRSLGLVLRDVLLTSEELAGLEQELLVSRAPALGTESVTEWLIAHGDELGRRYVNDTDRHFGREASSAVLAP
jgi:uncharacterized protein YbjT (DUF2867 family)